MLVVAAYACVVVTEEAGKALKLPLRRRPSCVPISWYVPFRVRTFMGALDGSGDMKVSEGRGPDIGESDRALCGWLGCRGKDNLVDRDGISECAYKFKE